MPVSYPNRVTIYEVGPRDGLQNEQSSVPSEAKVHYVDLLTAAGFKAIEATSFVNPKAVPQMADATQVMRGIDRKPGVRYPALVPNERGLNDALEAGVREIALFTAASESFTRANIHSTIADSLHTFRKLAAVAREHKLWIRGYVSTAFGCPYEGYVPQAKVAEVTMALFDMRVDEVSLGDTIGVGTPGDVERVLAPLLNEVPAQKLAVHFHDTRGTALANVFAALQMGITTVDSSSGGLGGCPFAPGAAGNLATEDLVYMLDGMGIETGVDLPKVAEASRYILGVLGKPPASKYLQAYLSTHSSNEGH
jgi:isopropylmalate/homocitrate/citramalate synthase